MGDNVADADIGIWMFRHILGMNIHKFQKDGMTFEYCQALIEELALETKTELSKRYCETSWHLIR